MSTRYDLDTSAPGTPPISLKEAREYLRSEEDEDPVVRTILEAAIQHAQAYTSRELMDNTWKLLLDGFPVDRRIVMRRSPVASISSIKYLQWDGVSADVLTTVASTVYYLKRTQYWSEALLFGAAEGAVATEWPDDVTTRQREENVEIIFVTAADENLPAIKPAILQIVAAVWANRGDCLDVASSDPITQSLAAKLLNPFRIARIRD